MVVKLCSGMHSLARGFESSVISYGSKTEFGFGKERLQFESSVISYGSKTLCNLRRVSNKFESSVISYGSKTASCTVNYVNVV